MTITENADYASVVVFSILIQVQKNDHSAENRQNQGQVPVRRSTARYDNNPIVQGQTV